VRDSPSQPAQWERLVACVCECDVEEGGYSLREGWAADSFQVQRGFGISWALHTECDHDDEDGGDDGRSAGPGSPRYKAHAVGHAHSPHSKSSYNCEDDSAGGVFADGVESDGQCDKCGSTDEGHVDQEADRENAFNPGSAEHAAVVNNVQHVGVFSPVLDQVVRRV
jgi:hypothetical protein